MALVLQSYAVNDILIFGYTDSTGSVEYNQTLSKQRAASIKTYLCSKGLSKVRLTTTGLGIADPITTNGTLEERSQNLCRKINT